MEKAELIADLLRAAPHDPLCAACLAFAVAASLDESRPILERLTRDGEGITRAAGRCAGCGRVIDVYLATAATPPPGRAPGRPATPETAAPAAPGASGPEPRPKCARCSFVIGEAEERVVFEGDAFHAYCHQVLGSAETIARSRARASQARKRLDESRRRIESRDTDPSA